MVIRCERCSTLYDLDEGLLSPSGSQVQCTRCQHLFTAYPPSASGRTIPGVPAPPARNGGTAAAFPAGGANPATTPAAPAAPVLPRARSAPRPTPAPGSAKPEPKPVRTAPPPVYRPSAPAPGAGPSPGVARGPVLRRDAVGAFEARLRRSARMRWLAPTLAAVAVALLVAGWFLLPRRGDHPSAGPRREALALAARDDDASLDQAIARLEEIERASPALRAAGADRAFVQVLRAGAIADEGESLSGRLASRVAERERLQRDRPEGWEQAERAVGAEVQALESEVRVRRERSRALAADALQALRRVEAEAGDTPEVVRGLVAYRALSGGRERLDPAAPASRGAGRDPWLDLASAWLASREPERAARERAVASLQALAQAHPELLRGRLLLARTEASLGRRAEAVTALDGLLAANARHDGARRLRDELTAPPPPVPVAAAPPVVKPAPRPRKIAREPAAPASPDAGDSAESSIPSPAAPAVAPPPEPAAVAPEPVTAPVPAPPGAAGGGAPGAVKAPAVRVPQPEDPPRPVDGG